MIEAHELTKRYGDTTAVHSLSFTIAPGTVTGFLGPNGAGKSTTMRMIMGLDRPTSGTVTVNGKPYRQHRAPLREVGALLEASAVHPGRSARSHLRSMAATHNIKASRVSEVSARPDLPPLRRTDRSSRKEPMTIPTKTPNLLDNPPVIRPQRRSKR
jgi:ABC-2 type transport system ATP-binding protein